MNNDLLAAKKKRNVKRGLFIASFISIPILHFLVFTVFVNLDTIALSFETFSNQQGKYVFVGLRNYKEFFASFSSPGSVMGKAIRNSLLFFALNDFVILPLSFLSAFFMYKKMPLSNTFRIIFFMPSIISTVVLTMLYSFMFDSSIGIIDSFMKLIGRGDSIPELGWFGDKHTAMPVLLFYCVWVGIGSNVVLISGAMSRIPTEMIEAGRLDGMTLTREMVSVTLPLTGSLLATLMMLGVPVIFTLFLQPMLITGGGPDGETYTIALYIVTAIRNENNLTMGAAVGILCALIGTPLVVILRKIVGKTFPVYEY